MGERGNNSKESKNTEMKDKVQIATQNLGDPLTLQSSDHPGMVLVSAPLVGTNFRSWHRAIRIALGAKQKLEFIEGTVTVPDKESDSYEQWKRCDFMVTSWILNSISRELVDGFIYTASARDLWLEITERFGECNGTMIYELRRKISLISQDNASASVYFTKLKGLWDELGSMETLPPCTCGASKAIDELNNRNRLMQFLMGLNDAYGTVRDQILGMDPLPSVNKAYSMVLKFESQKDILGSINGNTEPLVLMNRTQKQYQGRQKRPDQKKGHCSYCDMDGHVREGCFKLIGYPEWFKTKTKNNGQFSKTTRTIGHDKRVVAAVEAPQTERTPH
ncbi:uncharacterized protein LOC122722589 [Manihot esculenta]|uniref:uncharacterized protein LOC122722589 n=1 Tax=Manihot esculenta TaxID=3983 RepID=UPI001CC64122|nr:uncharacterized protein LOC122722589 [Manihot esculenta]